MFAVTLISWAFPLAVVAYLISLVGFISRIRREENDFWQSIGNPGLWEPNGQMAILKRVFLPGQMPERIALQYKGRIKAIRVFALLSLVLFVSVLLMIFMGVFEQPALK